MTPPRVALIVVDVQHGFDDPVWGPGNNPAAEERIARLLDAWEASGDPIVIVRHDSVEPASPLRPGRPGNALKPFVADRGDVLVAHDVASVVVCGITTNHCCETTSRVACDLGYEVTFVWDATRTFDRAAPGGSTVTADELTLVTRANLDTEFARVTDTDTLLRERAAVS